MRGCADVRICRCADVWMFGSANWKKTLLLHKSLSVRFIGWMVVDGLSYKAPKLCLSCNVKTIVLPFFVILACLVFSCQRNASKHPPPNKRLLSFQSKFTYSADEVEKLNRNVFKEIISPDFNKKTDTIKYRSGKIYISYLKATSGCSTYKGDVQFNKDTLKLLLNGSDTVCTEMVVWRMIFQIENKGNRYYRIRKD
jgi:hypothetical protein